FRFPQKMNSVHIQFLDRTLVIRSLVNATKGLERWLEFWRLSGLSSTESDAYLELSKIASAIWTNYASLHRRLSFDGEAAQRFRCLTSDVATAAGVASTYAMESTVPLLAGTFWLTNVYMPEYAACGSTTISCGNCGRAAFLRRFCHPVHSEVRLVIDCLRCGIVSDQREGAEVVAVQIYLPEVVLAGSSMTVAVTLSFRDGGARSVVSVVPRISTHGTDDLIPTPPSIECFPGVPGNQTLTFLFAIPTFSLRHGYNVKLLVASQDD